MVKKKSKFRHISILNKKYYFYSIKFSDPTGDSGWHTVEDIKKFVPSVMVTQAYSNCDKSYSSSWKNLGPSLCVRKFERSCGCQCTV